MKGILRGAAVGLTCLVSLTPASADSVEDFFGIWEPAAGDCKNFERELFPEGEPTGEEPKREVYISIDEALFLWQTVTYCHVLSASVEGSLLSLTGSCTMETGEATRKTFRMERNGDLMTIAGEAGEFRHCLSAEGEAALLCKQNVDSLSGQIDYTLGETIASIETDPPATTCEFYKTYIDAIEQMASVQCVPTGADASPADDGAGEMLKQHQDIYAEFCVPGAEQELPFQ